MREVKYERQRNQDRQHSGIGRRIKAATEAAEATYREKLEKSRDPGVDVRDFFTDEELERLLSENELFEGHLADWTAMQRYNKLSAAARWLDAHSMECFGIEIEGTAPSRPNTTVTLDIRRLASLHGKELKVYAAMTALADDLFISGTKDDHIRFTFGVRDIWKK